MRLEDMVGVAITIVIIAVVTGLGGTILDDIQKTQTQNTTSYNATGYGLKSIGTLASWLPTIILVIVLALIVGVILTYLMVRGGGV